MSAKLKFKELFKEKDKIELEISSPLEWREMPDKKESRIVIMKAGENPTDRNDWPRQHQWMVENLEKLHKAFSNRVKLIKESNYDQDDDSPE